VRALVTLDSNYSTRDVALHYKNGEIQLILSPSGAERYRLPSSAEVTIDMPGEALNAHAVFTDYKILRATLAGR
jgi:hypothetical protein